GKLIWLRFFPDDLLAMHDAAAATDITLLDAEVAMSGTSHVRLGRMLARRWRLPELYQDVIGFHHEVGAGTGNAPVCCVVQAADAVAHALELGWPSPLRLPAVQPEAWAALRLDPEALPDTLEAVQAEFQENLELFPLFTNDGAGEASGGQEAPPAPALAG
ncbi:MAG: HDOD domain-containing protein, partial [Candidatus Krumholzibacteriia bacterium]